MCKFCSKSPTDNSFFVVSPIVEGWSPKNKNVQFTFYGIQSSKGVTHDRDSGTIYNNKYPDRPRTSGLVLIPSLELPCKFWGYSKNASSRRGSARGSVKNYASPSEASFYHCRCREAVHKIEAGGKAAGRLGWDGEKRWNSKTVAAQKEEGKTEPKSKEACEQEESKEASIVKEATKIKKKVEAYTIWVK